MIVLVCIKQVMDPDAPLGIDDAGRWVDTTGASSWRMNRYDEYALEEAVLIRERLGGTVTALTVGPERAVAILKKALEKGADEVLHVLDPREAIPAMETAALIAEQARGGAFDLILTGVMSEDLMQSLAGPALAARLGLPCAAAVMAAEIDPDARRVAVRCELEGGVQESCTLPLPCVLTIQSGINRPRYPALSRVLAARSAVVPRVESSHPAAGSIRESFTAITPPPSSTKGLILPGTRDEKAALLLDLLHERSLI